ncbi:DUF5777 family beta-barrel protein [Mucilaginibacter sp. L3T2-6]|uniref:DUF5777 family beta-barrel protein n=1 Tax=Mucilaginibacter sp. L3T2-6 TaxID=3062491 RepID=UPI002676F067|nr:DUF5777 family beta-barrel protein [Mucilaginibacter sp. L3T2-6]MDO3643405.1 DUF5777 family beta-barrel protein [Mucilaginibacter sp. L3T2-6]MDV6215662.1 DUF5777 family beta-barrel protein [Mucilaginibacter sp. L3T2-6]
MRKYIILLCLFAISTNLFAQKAGSENKQSAADSLLNSMAGDGQKGPLTIYKSSRLILSQSTETIKKNNFNFLVIHRFGDFAGKTGGGKTYFGLDDVADVYIGFEYGLSDNFNIDMGRSTIGGLADLELKYAILHQANGGSPFAITLIGETGLRPYGTVFTKTSDRFSYFGQALIAHSFSPGNVLQIAPSFVRNNTPIPFVPDNDLDFFALSAALRLKVSRHAGFIVDYAHSFSSYQHTNGTGFSDPLGFGFEMETGGHVFTLNVTNARAVNEINYLSGTQSSYGRGQYRVGFTISRMFDFNRHKTDKKE